MKYKILAFLSSLFLLLMLCGCGIYTTYHNKKADDAISRAIYEKMEDDVYYLGRWTERGIKYYDYLLVKEDQECVRMFVSAIDQLKTNDEKTVINLRLEVPGGELGFASFANYSDWTLEKADYDGFYNFSIRIPNEVFEKMDFFENLSIYSEIKGVRQFCVDQKLQQRAEKMGIDWYEVWPDLEKLEIED